MLIDLEDISGKYIPTPEEQQQYKDKQLILSIPNNEWVRDLVLIEKLTKAVERLPLGSWGMGEYNESYNCDFDCEHREHRYVYFRSFKTISRQHSDVYYKLIKCEHTRYLISLFGIYHENWRGCKTLGDIRNKRGLDGYWHDVGEIMPMRKAVGLRDYRKK